MSSLQGRHLQKLGFEKILENKLKLSRIQTADSCFQRMIHKLLYYKSMNSCHIGCMRNLCVIAFYSNFKELLYSDQPDILFVVFIT